MGPKRSLSVLLVEDNPGDARLIQTYFGNGHRELFDLRIVDRLAEALRELEENTPDAILLDLGLPDSQGLQTLDRVKAHADGTPVIILTGVDDEELALEAIQRGAQDYLSKGGFDEELLHRAIRYAVERSDAEKLAQRNQERYERLFEQANEAVVVVQDEKIIGANPTAEELFGWGPSELVGKAFVDLVAPEDQDLVMSRHRQRMKGENPPTRYEFRVTHRDGSTRWVEVSTGRTEWKGNVADLSLLTDITDRKRSDEIKARLLERQTAVNELTLALGSAEEALRVYRVLYQHICRLVGAEFMHVLLLSEDQAELRSQFAVVDRAERGMDQLAGFPVDWQKGSLLGKAMLEGEPLLVDDYLEALDRGAVLYQIDDAGQPEAIRSTGELRGEVPRSAIIVPMRSEGEVVGVLLVQCKEPSAFDTDDVYLLAGLANVAAIALRNSQLVQQSRAQATRIREAFEGIIRTVSRTTETRDPYTAGHQQRTAMLAAAIAETLGIDADTVEGVRVAGTVHDIGKIGIPAEILSKPGKLTTTEFQIIQAHCESAHRILKDIEFPWPIAETVYQHHERLDGSGYPRGLAGDEICLEARILGVADVVEAMASHRPYRPALGIDAALEEVRRFQSTKYDRQAVEACAALFEERGFTFDESVSS